MEILFIIAVLTTTVGVSVNGAPQFSDDRFGSSPSGAYDNRFYKSPTSDYNNRPYFDNNLRRPYNPKDAEARIISQEFQTYPDGKYQYSYETENGINVQERSIPFVYQNGDFTKTVEGSYSFTSPDGAQVNVVYTADENGYHPHITYGGIRAPEYSNRPALADFYANN